MPAPRPALRLVTLLPLVALAALPIAACTSNGTDAAAAAEGGGDTVSVDAGDDSCQVSAAQAPSGTLRFAVTNVGTQVTEFYLLAQDGLRILGEVENVAPGISRDLVVALAPGTYLTACKPGMVGDGIRSEFTVTDSGVDVTAASDQDAVEQANVRYADYVKDQTDQLLDRTRAFSDAYTAGDDATARSLYPQARTHWERIETVAESFGDLDPRMDAREADLAPGEEFTGWHRLEKDLWPPADHQPLTAAERAAVAGQLVADTEELRDRTRDMSFTLDQIANGAKGLLDEVAIGKVTGEEEIWSHTDLWDFQANVDGARVAFEGVEAIVREKDPELSAEIEARFDDLQPLLDAHRRGDGFAPYTDLSDAEVKQLSDAVNALAEPLSRLTAAVLA